MIYKQHIVTDISITKLKDLYKLRAFLEKGTMKSNFRRYISKHPEFNIYFKKENVL